MQKNKQNNCLLIANAYNLPLKIFRQTTVVQPSKKFTSNPQINPTRQTNEYILNNVAKYVVKIANA
jgi:hypothetical protein